MYLSYTGEKQHVLSLLQKELGSGVFGTVYHGQIKVNPDDGSPIVAKRGEGGEISSPLLQARGRVVANVDVAIKVVPLVKAEEHSKTEGNEEAMHAEQLQKKKDKRKEKQRSALVVSAQDGRVTYFNVCVYGHVVLAHPMHCAQVVEEMEYSTP